MIKRMIKDRLKLRKIQDAQAKLSPRMASALVASAGSVDSVAAGAEPEMLSQIELRSPPATATAFLSLASSCHGSPMALTPTLRTE